MSGNGKPTQPRLSLHVLAHAKEATSAALRILAEEIQGAISQRGRAALALSGGKSPRALYRELGSGPMQDWDAWPSLHAYWVDERAVGPDHPDSNYRMAWDLFLSQVPIPEDQIHRMRGEAEDLDEEAVRYEQELEDWWVEDERGILRAAPRLDVILLGMGADGHTASLFPESSAAVERARWVMPTTAPPPHTRRLTLTPPILSGAEAVLFLVFGEDKAEAVRRALESDEPALRVPARGVRPADGRLYWILDEAAASRLERTRRASTLE
jgi:6-phosphogluconolactonase